MSRHRVVITGGGTGGHIYPALSVYEQLKDDPDVESILYIGAKGHLEEQLAAERQIQFIGLNSVGMPRRLSLAIFSWPFKTFAAANAAKKAVSDFNPTVVLGTGGYAAAPPLFAALSLGIPYAVHEPDAHPGLVNKLFAPQSALCSLGMEGAAATLKSAGNTVVNGNPIRSSFSHPPSREEAATSFGLDPALKTLLITGGSQGAQAINEAVLAALPELLKLEPGIQILHQVGSKTFADYQQQLAAAGISDPRYHCCAYINDLAVAYAACDATICRAGAMTIAELGVSATPAIFIPYPFAAQDHQTHNARAIEDKGAARVILQKDLTKELLMSTIREVLLDDAHLGSMREAMRAIGKPDAARNLADQIKEISASFASRKSAS